MGDNECRACGCTAKRPCSVVEPCSWPEIDLCSTCDDAGITDLTDLAAMVEAHQLEEQ